MKKWLVAAFGLSLLFAAQAFAGGMFQGYPAITLPFSNSECIPADTNLSSGRSPQTVCLTPSQLGLYAAPAAAITASGTAFTPNLSSTSVLTINRTTTSTIANPSNGQSGRRWTLIITNGSTTNSAGISSWGSTFKWASSTAPTLTSTYTKWDVISCVNDGTYNNCWVDAASVQ